MQIANYNGKLYKMLHVKLWECNICGIISDTDILPIEDHMEYKHEDSMFKCYDCHNKFINENELEPHYQICSVIRKKKFKNLIKEQDVAS